jgi:hypothetical protein
MGKEAVCVCCWTWTDPRALGMAGKCPATEPHPSPRSHFISGLWDVGWESEDSKKVTGSMYWCCW